MKVLIAKKVDDPSCIILEVIDMPTNEGAVNYSGRFNDGYHEAVALGRVSSDIEGFGHRLHGVRELRDWLTEHLPDHHKFGREDVRKFALDPVKPMRGDVVTVAGFDDLVGVGKPQVVLDHIDGFTFHSTRHPDGNITSRMTEMSPSATVLLAYTDQSGITLTQIAPVMALRPWTDPKKPAAAQTAG